MNGLGTHLLKIIMGELFPKKRKKDDAGEA